MTEKVTAQGGKRELTAPGRANVLEGLARGEIGAVALTEAYLARIARYGQRINPFITVTADLARDQAAAADAALERGETAGPLHGLPIAIKDNIDVGGVRATAGSRFFAEKVPSVDAEVARRLREAGAVLVGKATLHEFAYGATTDNPHYGTCRNPWDPTRIPGGSSGGSGAVLAADFCLAALGTDTGGSVRIPAALNGVSALRPTTGRVSNRGVFPITWSFDTVGPMARSVRHVAALMDVLADFDGGDPLSVDRPADDYLTALDQGIDGLRIGLPERFFLEDVDPDIVRAVREAADRFSNLGATVDEIEVPRAEEAGDATTRLIWADALAIHRQRLTERPELFGEDLQRRLRLGEGVSGTDYATCVQFGREWNRLVEELFRDVDVILTPATAIPAPRLADCETIETTRQLTRFTYGWSLAELPVLALPCGFSAEGLPVGMQLAAAQWKEATLLRTGAAFQRETRWHLEEPLLA